MESELSAGQVRATAEEMREVRARWVREEAQVRSVEWEAGGREEEKRAPESSAPLLLLGPGRSELLVASA